MKTIRFGLAFALALGLSATLFAQSTTPVADAARRGDAVAVKTLLKGGADVNAAHPDGMTPMHWAAERGDAALAAALIPAGANVTALTRLGAYSPLHLAARSGSGPVVRALLKAGASPTAPAASGAAPIHLAAASGNVDAINAIIDAGADVNVKENENQQTPLIFAVSQGHVEAIKVLVKRGANVNAATKATNLSQQSAEIRQATTIRRQVLSSIVPPGSQPTPTQDQIAVAAAREFYATGKAPAPPSAGGAAGGGRGGAGGGGGRGGAAPPVAAAGAAGSTAGAAQPAAAAPGGRGRAGAAGAGAPAAGGAGAAQPTATDLQNAEGPNVSGSAKGGLTALHHAARDGFTDAIPVLLDAGADINKKSADGNSALLVALINGQFDAALLLVEKGANPNFVGEAYGVTPLWAAVNARWQPRTRFPQPQEMDYQKATYLDVMKALLEAGADPDVRVRAHPWFMLYSGCGSGNCGLAVVTGSTAFWRAAYGTDVDAMKLLVQYGADPNIPTMAGGGRGGGGGGGRGGGGRGGGAGAAGGSGGAGAAGAAGAAPAPAAPPPPPTPTLDPSGLPPVPAGGPGVPPLHAAAGAEYGEGFAGNAHRHAPEAWLASVKYLVEVLGMDVNSRDDGGYTPLHHAAARGDNEVILYLVSKGADVKAVSRRGQTTVDMANGPVSRISPYPKTIELLMSLGAKNNNRCASCAP